MDSAAAGASADLVRMRDEQYRTSAKLRARANLHQRYGNGEPWFNWVARKAALPAGASVLDVGCGPGWQWEAGAADFPPGLSLTLTDLSQGMVDEALGRVGKLERYSSVTGRTADAQALPFDDASFDAVLACHMLYHVPDPGAALDEIRRVLKPGGIIAITSNGRDNLREMYALGAAAFGGLPSDPSAVAFSLEDAGPALSARFDTVETNLCPGELAVTNGEDMVAALISYPPGETAPETQVDELRRLIAARMEAGGGVIRIPKVTGMVRGLKP